MSKKRKVIEYDDISKQKSKELKLSILPKQLVIPKQPKQKSPPQYFSLPTTIAAVGPRGSGKTYNLCIWNKWMCDNGYFTRVYVISPTYDSNPPLHLLPIRPEDIYKDKGVNHIANLSEIEQKVEADAYWYELMTTKYTEYYELYKKVKKNVSKLEKDVVMFLRSMQSSIKNFYDNYKRLKATMTVSSPAIEYTLRHYVAPPETRIETMLDTMHDDTHPWFYPPVKMKRPCPLLFIDDCSHSPLYTVSHSNPLVNLTLRHRHIGGVGYGLSIEFAVQTFLSGIPKALRGNTMQFLCFHTYDLKTIDDIYNEVGSYCSKGAFMKLYFQATKDRHDFLLIDTNCNNRHMTFRKGWDTIIFADDDLDSIDSGNEEDDESEEES